MNVHEQAEGASAGRAGRTDTAGPSGSTGRPDASLKELLEGTHEEQDQDQEDSDLDLDQDPDQGLCCECRDMRVEVECRDCDEDYCGGCFQLVHSGGKRRLHSHERLAGDAQADQAGSQAGSQADPADAQADSQADSQADAQPGLGQSTSTKLLQAIRAQAKYIPVRLSAEERHLLHLLEAALSVSDYTGKVDILSYTSKSKRIIAQLKEMCSILLGLFVASDLKKGEDLIRDKDFSHNAAWFQAIFEVGRRFKIMNPDKMRSSFGKLCYMVMDSKLPEIEAHMEFNLHKPIKTIHAFLNSKGEAAFRHSVQLFDDELLLYATMEISPEGKPRAQINREIKHKESSIRKLATRYSSPSGFSRDDIEQVLYSIADYNAFTHANRAPIQRFLQRLKQFADPDVKQHFSIGIQYGRSGARLTHDHDRQYHYVEQSLTLWSLIQREMIHLWSIADDDLFSSSSYKLASTGQGLNRIKACPGLAREMYRILSVCKQQCSSWIGSSVVHLGDDAVPNALFFLDKYTQVPSILIPIDRVLLQIDRFGSSANDEFILKYIESQFDTKEKLKLTILQDCFAHMFDGSGADNFYMSGSCIDGRLTSAWNHTNQISKKSYFNFFLLSGFTGFNGAEGF